MILLLVEIYSIIEYAQKYTLAYTHLALLFQKLCKRTLYVMMLRSHITITVCVFIFALLKWWCVGIWLTTLVLHSLNSKICELSVFLFIFCCYKSRLLFLLIERRASHGLQSPCFFCSLSLPLSFSMHAHH